MNNSLFFYREWPLRLRVLFGFGCTLILALLCFSVFAWYNGLENVIRWDVASELHQKLTSSPVFNDGTLGFSASSLVYYVKERYLPGLIEVNIPAYQILFISGLAGLIFVLTGSFRLKGVWFLVSVIFIGGFLLTLRLENAFAGTNQASFLLAFAFVAGLFYILNSWAAEMDTLKAAALFSGLICLLFTLFIYQSKINQPVLSVASYGLIGFLVISSIFIFMISHEILAGLIWMVSQTARKGSSSIPQFMLISFIFLLNALLIYMENSKKIDESLLILNPLILYIISLVLGLWGLKKMLEQGYAISFSKTGVWVYSGMALITTATIGFIYATANDPLQEAMEDYIAICQLAAGLAFFIHVLVNFYLLFRQGLDVHKVLYKPPFSRLILARVGALFLVAGFFSFNNFYSYYQVMAGYNNAIGDYYLAEGDLSGAETFYKQSTHYELLNHKANFTLASMALGQEDKTNAGFFFKQAIEKKPSAFAFAGLSRSLENEDLFFDAMFTVQKGVRTFPESSQLLTNLAYFQSKARLTDSVLYYLNEAKKYCTDCEVENANFLAFWIENGKKEKLAEMSGQVPARDYYSNKANRAAVAKVLGTATEADQVRFRPDSALDVSRFAYLYNTGTNILVAPSGLSRPEMYSRLQQNELNAGLQEDLAYLKASANYFSYNKTEGLKQLSLLAENAVKNKPMYDQNLGLWFLKEGVYDKAVYYLNRAGDSSSVALLAAQKYSETLDERLELQAGNIVKGGITAGNLGELLNKAPLNPYLLEKVTQYLSGIKRDGEAYNLLFYATDLNPSSAKLWKLYVYKALDMSQTGYADNGLAKLKTLLPAGEYEQFKSLFELKKAERQKKAGNF